MAVAYQVPVEPFDQATVAMPGSGLAQTVSVTGATSLLDATTVAARGSTPSTYRPAIAPTTPAQDVLVGTGTCAATGSCGDRGTLTITFSRPVRDPILHLAGLGGAVTQTVDGRPRAQSEVHSVLQLTTPGLSLRTAGQGNNLAVTTDTITATNHDAGPRCDNLRTGEGPDASATAACGSVQVNGVTTSVAFDVTAVFTKNPELPAFNTRTSGDAFSIVASVGEDFGDAPPVYGAAWSVLSDVRLGSEATAENTDLANRTTGPVTPDQADDGVTFPRLLTTATTYSVPVELTGASQPGRVCGWIDADRDGSFQQAERSCGTFAAGQSAVNLNWSGLPRPKTGTTYARVRVGYDAEQVEKPTGASDAGEVEDHPVVIAPPPPPDAVDDTVTTPFGTGISTDVLGNDKPGDPAVPLQPESLCLVDGNECGQLLAVAGQGKYVATAGGRIDFEPVPGFVGRARPVTYRVADSNGATATATLTVTVALPDKPAATPDTASTPQNVSITLRPLANDKPAAGVTFDPRSVVVRDPADAMFKKKVTVRGEGSYLAKPTGGVDFVPVPRFTGVGTTIGYRVTDSTGQVAESSLVVTVTPVTPKALGDSVSTAYETAVVVPVLGNDVPGSVDAPLNPATLRLLDPATGRLTGNVVVKREGVYQVADGKVEFAPASRFKGSTTPLTYQVQDKNGTPVRADLVVSVAAPGPPVANPDTVTTLQGMPVSVLVLDNDKPGPTGSPLVPDSVRLLPPGRGQPGTSLQVPGVGRYTVKSDGRILFEPVPAFHGQAEPVGYQVADGNGSVGRATLTVDVSRVQPDATDDTVGTAYDRTVTIPVLSNDAAGDPAIPLVPSSVRLIDPVGDQPRTTVTVAGQATYEVLADGRVQVDPLPTFTGVADPLTYTVSDVNGTVARAKVTVRIAKPAPPIAKPDTATTKQDVTVTIEPLGNDEAGQGTALDPLSVVLVDPADGALRKAITVPTEGRYAVRPDGMVAFDPVPAFTGETRPITYRVADQFDQTGRSTIGVTVTAVKPTAADDIVTTPHDKTVTIAVLGNDRAGDPSAPLVPAGVLLGDPVDGGFKGVVMVAREGAYRVHDGKVDFDPLPSFTGRATDVTYRVADDNGTFATAIIRVTVGAPAVARPDSATTLQDITVSVDVLANDRPGTGARLDPSSVVLREGASAVRRDGFAKSVTVPGEGRYSVQPDGAITFDPLPSFHGNARPVRYRVTDTFGGTAESALVPTVTAIEPVTVDDTGITPPDQPITVNVLANDKPGHPSAPLVSARLVLKDPADGRYRDTVSEPKEGTYTANDDGTITFRPVRGFQGLTTPATYRVSDDNGTTAEGLLFLTVGQGPEARPDTAGTRQNQDVTVEVLGNDRPGTSAELEKSSVRLFGTQRVWGRQATIAGQGTFTADAVTGRITFDPVPAYSGPSSIAYQVRDTSGNTATSTITVTVDPIVPKAGDDRVAVAFGRPVTVRVLANDKAGDVSAPLVAGSVRLVDPATGDPVASLRVAGQGTYTSQLDGGVRFVPSPGVTGDLSPVGYRVADSNGTVANAGLTVTVGARPVALPDAARTKQAQLVVIDPLTNDEPAGSFDPATLLLADAHGNLTKTMEVRAEGRYVVADGKITFTPETRFTGTARPVRYEVKDDDRIAARSTVTVTVDPVRPKAVDDGTRTAYGASVVVRVLANDEAGDPSAPLVPASVVLRDPSGAAYRTAVRVPGEGTFSARPDGTVSFTPVQRFTGTSAVTYRVSDRNGTSDLARLDVTVGGPLPAKAAPDAATGTPGNPVVLNPLLNDAPTTHARWDPTTLCLVTTSTTCDGRQHPKSGGQGRAVLQTRERGGGGVAEAVVGGEVRAVGGGAAGGRGAGEAAGGGVVSAEGEWTVGADGSIRLVPARGFTGTAELTYRIADSNGVTVESQVKVTVGARATVPPTPVAASSPPPTTGDPTALLLTLGALLASLGISLLTLARHRRRP